MSHPPRAGGARFELIPLETPVSRALGFRVHLVLADGLLVDTGFRRVRERLFGALRNRRIEQAVNTHAHEDHSGNNQALLGRLPGGLHAPAAALAALAEPWRDTRHFYQRVIWGLPEPSWPAPLGAVLEAGRFAFQVIATPGHSRDHVCLFEPRQGWLLAGDLFLGIRVRQARPYENGPDLIASLELVLALEPAVMVCYHRGLVSRPVTALGRKLAWLRELRDRAGELAGRGLSVARIAAQLLGPDPPLLHLLTGGDVRGANLIAALLKEPGRGYEY